MNCKAALVELQNRNVHQEIWQNKLSLIVDLSWSLVFDLGLSLVLFFGSLVVITFVLWVLVYILV